MLSGRLILACGLAASLGVAFVRAEDRNGAEKGDAGLAPPAASTTAGAVDAPYPHIYQAPLFGSLFAVSSEEAAVDESALRYYASLHNFDRANAEIRRLKALHPNWTPPTNIYSSAGAGVDEQPFWDLLAADRMDELHAAIALKEKAEPGWKPSRDLTTKVARKEAIEALVKKSDQKQSAGVLAIADADPSILHCAYMDANWRVADAFLDIGLPQRAFEIYHAIIATCPDHDERLVTVRKAVSRFSFDQTRALFAMGAKSADGASEFDAVKVDFTRARLAAVNAGKSAETIEPGALEDFFVEATRTHQPADLSLAGWFEYNRGRYETAQRWFSLAKLGAPAGADAAAINLAEGLALSTLKAGRVEAAIAVAYAWRDASKTLRDTYVSASAALLTRASPLPDISESLLADFSAFVEGDRNFLGAAALGWYRYNRGDWDDAIVWFRSALTFKGEDPNAGPPSADVAPEVAGAVEGYGRALARVGRLDEATLIADRWRKAGPALESVFVSLMEGAIESAPAASAIASERLAHFEEVARTRQDVASAAALGWLDYRSKDFAGAIGWFRNAIAWSPQGRGELTSNQGLALSLKQTDRFTEAEDVAWGWIKESADMRAIYVAAMVAEFDQEKVSLSPLRIGRFESLIDADRSAVGAQALGWRRMKEGNCAYAAPWFRKARGWSADGKQDAAIARGLTLSLKAVGAFADAEDLAFDWRDRDATLRGLYIDIGVEELTTEAPIIPMSEARVRRLSERVLADHDIRGARALGWWRYRQAACGFGGDWLRLAIAWSDADKRDAKTDEGFGLTLRATGRLAEAAGVAWPWVDKVALMKKLYIDVMVEELSRDNPPEPIDETRLKDFAATIEPIESPLGAQALGWYRYERHEYDDAARWFKHAVDWWPQQRRDLSKRLSAPVDDYEPILAKLALIHEDYRRTPRAYPNSSALIDKAKEAYVNTEEGFAKTQEGYALTLRSLGRLEEAEAIAWAWRDRWPSLRTLFVDIAAAELTREDGPQISPERLSRYTVAIEADRSSSGAAAMAWRQYRAKAFDGAAEWFGKALGWSKPNPPDPGLVEGYVAALQASDKFEQAEKIAAMWRGASARFNLIYLQGQLREYRAHHRSDQMTAAKYAEIEAALNQSHSADDALSLAWLAYEGRDFSRALIWFRNAQGWASADLAPKAKQGVALSLRALDRFEELADFGSSERDVAAVHDVYFGGMIAWLTAEKPAHEASPATRARFEQIVTEEKSALGAQALGWRALRRRDWPTARHWFETAIGWSGLDPLAPPEKLEPEQAKLIEGYVQAQRGSGEGARAEDVAFAWRGASPALGVLYLQIVTDALNDDASGLTSERISRFAAFTDSRHDVDAAAALGWRAYRGEAHADAISWFAKAVSWAPDGKPPVKVAEGYALSLRAAGRLLDAESFASRFAADSADMRAIYVSTVVKELADDKIAFAGPRLDRFISAIVADHSAVGAQALGWRRLKEGNCVYAAPWFRKASAWSADSSEDAATARGLALALRKVGAFHEAEELAYAWRDRDPEMDAIYIDIGVEQLTSEAPALKMSEPRVQRLAARVLATHHVAGARALGWWRYRQAGEGYGGEWLRLAIAWSDADKRDAKTDEGFGLTLRAIGRLAEAETVAHAWADKAPLMQKLYIDVLVEELSRDNPPEPIEEARLNDFAAAITPIKSALGAQALGWYRLERGEYDEAARWFANAVAWWPAQRGDRSKRLSAPVDDYKPILAKLALVQEEYRRTPLAYPNSSSLIGKSTEDYVNTEQGFAKTQEGYALTLRALGRMEQAEAIAWSWRDRWPSLRALFVDIAAAELDRKDGPELSPERVRRYLEAIEADRSSTGAAALAWRQYRLGAFDSAGDWFRKAIDWSKTRPPEAGLVQGYVMTLQAAKKFVAAEAVAKTWRDASPDFEYVYALSQLQRVSAPGGADKLSAAQFAEIETAMKKAHSTDGALELAWVAYQAHDYASALVWFRQTIEWGGDTAAPKAKEGVALSLRGLERYEELASFGYTERGVSPALHDAWFGGMVAWLTADKPLRDVKPEAMVQFAEVVAEEKSPVGAQALAWGALLRKDFPASRQWFESAIAWTGFDPLAAPERADPARAKLIEGYVQALRSSSDLVRAENVAYFWRDAGATLAGLYLEIFTQALADDGAALSDERVARFAALAKAKRSPQAAGALAWRAYRDKSFGVSIAWFEKAIAWLPADKGDAKIDEGYALALRAAGRLTESEEFAWSHRGEARELRAAYVAAFSDQLLDEKLSSNLPPARLERFAGIVKSDKISTGASALGWRRLKDGNCSYSLGWFRKSIAWSDKSVGDGKLYSGYAQGLRAVGMFNEGEDAAFTWADRSKEARELYTNIVIEELTKTWPRVEMSETRVERFSQLVAADRSAPGAQALGWWRYMQAGWSYGGRWFELAAGWSLDQRGDAKLNEGYSLTQRAVGRLSRAETLAYPWIERTPAMKKLYIDIAVEELSRDYPPEPIPEDRVTAFAAAFDSIRSPLGAQSLGWYRYARGEYPEAARWFEKALEWWPPQKADSNQKLAVPVDDYQAILARLALRPEDYRRTPRAYPNSSLLIGHDAESYVDTDSGLAKTVEGYVRTLAALSRWDDAEALGFKWLERWPPMRQVLVDMAAAELSSSTGEGLSADRLARFVKLIDDSRSAVGAEALAWKAYKATDFSSAARWFRSDMDWRGRENPSLDVARAYADSLRNQKQYDVALKFVAAWRDRVPGLDAIALDISLDSVAELDPTSPEATARVGEIAAGVSAAKSAAGAASMGWLANRRGEFAVAEAWFKKAIQWAPAGKRPDPKALEGYARAIQGEGRFADVLRFVDAWSAEAPNLKPLFMEAAAQKLAAAAGNGEAIAPNVLARAAKAFAEAKSVNGAQALAWQRVSVKDWVAATAWFKAARDWSGSDNEDPKILEGLVIALRNSRHDDEAEATAYQGAQHDETLRGLYVEVVADRLTRKPAAPPNQAGMQRYADFVLAAKSANGAQALGWYSYNARQLETAAAWFAKALEFEPTEDEALGLAFSYRKLGDRENYARVIETYRDAYAKIAQLAGRRWTREQRAALESGAAPVRRLRATLIEQTPTRSAPQSAGVSGENATGWRLLNQARPSESAEMFETSLRTAKGRQWQEAAYGRVLALLASGKTTEAGRAASSVELTKRQRNDLGVQLLATRAWDAYNGDRFAEALHWLDRRAPFSNETRDLMQLRIWCLQKLGKVDAATAIQSQLDRQLAP